MVTLSITFRVPNNVNAKSLADLVDACYSAQFVVSKQARPRQLTARKVWGRIWYCPAVAEELEKICGPRTPYRRWLRHVEVNSGIDFRGLDIGFVAPGSGYRVRECDSCATRALELVIEDRGLGDSEGTYPAVASFHSALRCFISLAAIYHIAKQGQYLDGGSVAGTIAGAKKKLVRIQHLCEGKYDPHVVGSAALTSQPSR